MTPSDHIKQIIYHQTFIVMVTSAVEVLIEYKLETLLQNNIPFKISHHRTCKNILMACPGGMGHSRIDRVLTGTLHSTTRY